MNRRGLLLLVAGLGTAGAAIFLSAGVAHAATPGVPVDPVPVSVPVVRPRVVVRPVVEGVRRSPVAPVAAPIVGAVVTPAHLDGQQPLAILSRVVPPAVGLTAGPSRTARPTDQVPVHLAAPRGSLPFTSWRVPAGTGDSARREPMATISAASPSPRSASGSGARFVSSRALWGVTAEQQTQSRGGVSAASMPVVTRIAASEWKPLAVVSGRALRPGVARDLASPG